MICQYKAIIIFFQKIKNKQIEKKGKKNDCHLKGERCRTYIPFIHGGSLTSSMENSDFKSEDDTNFRRGAEGADRYFLPTGKTTYTNSGLHLNQFKT